MPEVTLGQRATVEAEVMPSVRILTALPVGRVERAVEMEATAVTPMDQEEKEARVEKRQLERPAVEVAMASRSLIITTTGKRMRSTSISWQKPFEQETLHST